MQNQDWQRGWRNGGTGDDDGVAAPQALLAPGEG